MDYGKESLKMHYDLKGKIEMVSRAAVDSKEALSLAYTPVSYTHLDVYKRQSRYSIDIHCLFLFPEKIIQFRHNNAKYVC